MCITLMMRLKTEISTYPASLFFVPLYFASLFILSLLSVPKRFVHKTLLLQLFFFNLTLNLFPLKKGNWFFIGYITNALHFQFFFVNFFSHAWIIFCPDYLHIYFVSFQLSPVKENGCGLKAMELMDRLEEREQHIRQIELELAQTKLALVEAQCRNQDLSHQVCSALCDCFLFCSCFIW